MAKGLLEIIRELDKVAPVQVRYEYPRSYWVLHIGVSVKKQGENLISPVTHFCSDSEPGAIQSYWDKIVAMGKMGHYLVADPDGGNRKTWRYFPDRDAIEEFEEFPIPDWNVELIYKGMRVWYISDRSEGRQSAVVYMHAHMGRYVLVREETQEVLSRKPVGEAGLRQHLMHLKARKA